MSETTIPVGTTGKELRAEDRGARGLDEYVVLADKGNPDASPKITDATPSASDFGMVVRVVGNLTLTPEVEISNDTGNPVPIAMAQSVDAGNTVTRTAADGATQYVGAWTRTRSIGIVRQLVVLASTVSSGLGGTFIFEYSEDGANATISESRPIGDFASVRDFDLINAGEYFRVKFTPSRALTGGEMVFITTTQRRQNDGQFVRLANQQIEEANAAMGQAFAYLKAFIAGTGKSVNLRATPDEAFITSDAKMHATPSGSIYTEGFRRQIEHIFSASKGAAAIAALQNGSTGGTVSLDATNGQAIFETGAAPGDSFQFFSQFPFDYQSGQAITGSRTIHLESLPTGDQYFEWGCSDLARLNGTGWGVDATGIYTFRMFGGVRVTKTYQTNWNRDKCNGVAPSLFKFNGTAQALVVSGVSAGNNIFYEEFEWYGADSHNYYIKPPQSTPPLIVHVEELPNNSARSSLPDPNIFMFVAGYNGTAGGNLILRSGSWRGGIFSSDGAVVASDDAGIAKTIGRDGEGSSLNVYVRGNETAIALKALTTWQVRQFPVGDSAVQLDVTKLTNRKSVQIRNHDATNNVYINSTSAVTQNNGEQISPKGAMNMLLGGSGDIWACTETGGTRTDYTRYGSTNSGTATSPANAMVADATFATVASAQTVNVGGFTAGTSNPLVSVKLGVKGRKKATPTTETVAFVGVTTGNSTTSSVATSAAVTAGTLQCLLAFISREGVETITGVSGAGLTWTQVKSQVSDDAHRTLDCWKAVGTTTATTVTATLSSAESCHIAVLQFSGVDQTTPVQANGGTVANSATVTGPAIAGTNLGMAILAVSQDSTTATAGAGYTERSDEKQSAGTIDGLSTHTKPLVSAGTETGTATLAGAKHYVAVGVTLSPAASYDPIATLSYTVSATPGVTSGAITFSSTTNADQTPVNVTGDRSWVYGDIANVAVILTGTTVTAAAVEVDALYLLLTDSTGITVRVSLKEIGGTP